MDVLKKINKMRLDRDWSIYRLSLESGIPQSTLTNMFNRETLPSITTLQLICDAFGVTLSEFFYEDAPKGGRDDGAMLKEFSRLDEKDRKLIWDLMERLNRDRHR